MKLLTKAIEKKFMNHPIGSQDGKGEDAEVLLKVFNPYGAGTWLITEAEKEGDDWLCYGCHCITDWEWGYVSLGELQELKLNVYGMQMGLERDMYCEGMTVAQLKD